MAVGWTPTDTLLGTVVENQSFSYSITYITLDETETEVEADINITAVSPQGTIIVSGNTISGHFKYAFSDKVEYLNWNKEVVTLTGTPDQGTWELFDFNDCYQLFNFEPDTSRHREFQYNVTATYNLETVATETFTIDVDDPSWTPGQTALVNVITQIKERGG